VYILDYTGLLYLTLGELREECLSRWWKEKKRRVVIHHGIYGYIYMNDGHSHGVTYDITDDITRGLEHSGSIRSVWIGLRWDQSLICR